jgi:peptide/nickel transport system permease protein
MATTDRRRILAFVRRWDSIWLNGKLLLGGCIFLSMLSIQLIGPLFWDTELAKVASSPTNLVPLWAEANPALGFKPADPAHPLGTESNGRDMLALLIVATPRSLRVGVIGASIGIMVGIILGFSAGFLGGRVDTIIRIAADVWLTIPGLAVLIVIASYVSQLEINVMAALMALFAWPGPTRFLRAQILSMRERGYIQMARLSGASTFDIMFKEIMPNLLPYLAAGFTSSISGVILAAAGLETLGLGPTRIPTLGMTINYALRSSAILRGMWWWWGFPIAILIIIFVALFLVTIGLDEISNPRLRGVVS